VLVALIIIAHFEACSRHFQEVLLYTALALMTITWKLDNVETKKSARVG